ncbi:DUF1304 family protein [Archangium violaceum]|uniref:DUF1304 family protein n=1 Tax=Archangium violaceum TaxID=83451 RepID=UPI0036DBC8C3
MVLEMFFWDHAVGERVFELPREVLVKLSVLGCVVVAGVFGAFTARFSILFMQAMPGLLARVLVRMSRPRTQMC